MIAVLDFSTSEVIEALRGASLLPDFVDERRTGPEIDVVIVNGRQFVRVIVRSGEHA